MDVQWTLCRAAACVNKASDLFAKGKEVDILFKVILKLAARLTTYRKPMQLKLLVGFFVLMDKTAVSSPYFWTDTRLRFHWWR